MRWVAVIALGVVLVGLGALARPRSPGLLGLVEGETGSLAGAVVRLKGGEVLGQSDLAGVTRLPASTRGQRITASKEGFFIAGADVTGPFTRLRLKRLPDEDHDAYEW